jgi:hypothetical protein
MAKEVKMIDNIEKSMVQYEKLPNGTTIKHTYNLTSSEVLTREEEILSQINRWYQALYKHILDCVALNPYDYPIPDMTPHAKNLLEYLQKENLIKKMDER